VLALAELVERLGVIEVLDAQIGPVKVRDRVWFPRNRGGFLMLLLG
jgi:hypothetical protein